MAIPVTPDTRPLHERVRAMARRYDAIVSGGMKTGMSVQDITNAQRDAAILHVAANRILSGDTYRDEALF